MMPTIDPWLLFLIVLWEEFFIEETSVQLLVDHCYFIVHGNDYSKVKCPQCAEI